MEWGEESPKVPHGVPGVWGGDSPRVSPMEENTFTCGGQSQISVISEICVINFDEHI